MSLNTRPEIITHAVPGTDLEISIRPFYLGQTHGWRYGVAAYIRNDVLRVATKAAWRQRGSEFECLTIESARAKANEMWLAHRVAA